MYTILGSFCSFLNFYIQPQIRSRKIPAMLFFPKLTFLIKLFQDYNCFGPDLGPTFFAKIVDKHQQAKEF